MKETPHQQSNRAVGEPDGVRQAVEHPAAGRLGIAQFRGPLPPPAVLERYERLLPEAAERVLRVAEEEQTAGRDFATEVVRATATETGRRRYLAFAAV